MKKKTKKFIVFFSKQKHKKKQKKNNTDKQFIFPEGTTSHIGLLTQFKTGAFVPGLSVRPLCLRFENNIYSELHDCK